MAQPPNYREVQYKDSLGKWIKLPIPIGVTIDEPAFAFNQAKQRGLITRVVSWDRDGKELVVSGPFSVQRGPR